MRTYMSDSVWALFMHEAIPISGGTGRCHGRPLLTAFLVCIISVARGFAHT